MGKRLGHRTHLVQYGYTLCHENFGHNSGKVEVDKGGNSGYSLRLTTEKTIK